jgi:hypothetical protein
MWRYNRPQQVVRGGLGGERSREGLLSLRCLLGALRAGTEGPGPSPYGVTTLTSKTTKEKI